MNFLNKLTLSFSFIFVAKLLIAQPANDNCNNPIILTQLDNWCSAVGQFSNVNATASPEVSPLCFPNTESHDVWFAFVAVANMVNVNLIGNAPPDAGGTLQTPEFAIYSGTCGTNLVELECISANFGQNIVETFSENLTIGETYFIRVDARNGNTGTFQLCINNFNRVPEPSSDCSDAVLLCDKSPFSVQSVLGAGEDTNEIDPMSCIQDEISSVWYKWICDQPGTLSFTLTPNKPSDDLDFAVFELPGGPDDCNNKVMLRCMASGENVGEPFENWEPCTGPTGLSLTSTDLEEFPGCQPGNDNFVAALNMEAGKTYALIVNNFSNSGSGFSITWGGTGTFKGPLADFEIEPSEGVACEEDLLLVDVSSSQLGSIVAWNWNFGEGAVPQTAQTAGPHDISYLSVGKKFIVLTVENDQGCVVTKVIEIEIEPCCPSDHDLEVGADPNDPICADTPSGSIAASASGGFPGYEFSLDGENFSMFSDFNQLPEGDYWVWVQDTKGCRDSIDVSLFDPPPLSVYAGEDVTIELGDYTDLEAEVIPSTSLVDYLWTPDIFLSCDTCPDPTAAPVNTTTYTVVVTNEAGCTAIDDVTIFLEKDRLIYIPNAFSPNGDGTNDNFTLYGGKSASKIQLLRIFNRWGALVFEGRDMDLGNPNQGWDGTFKGKDLPPDVFAYYAIVEFLDNEVVLFEGDVTIVK